MQQGPTHEFQGLMERLNAGDEVAASELLVRYGPHILRVVRRKLSQNQKLRSKFDSQDFMQDVWTSFFTDHAARGRFERPEALVEFLAKMAYRKVIDAFREQLQTQKNNANIERSLESYQAKRGMEPMGRQPTPSRVASAREEWARLLQGKPRHYRDILVLLGQGENYTQIAQKLGLNERTVRRLVQKISLESEV